MEGGLGPLAGAERSKRSAEFGFFKLRGFVPDRVRPLLEPTHCRRAAEFLRSETPRYTCYYTTYFHVKPSVTQGHHVNQGDPIGTLDNSGCQSGAHLHVQRKNTSGVPVNFTIPCTNPTPKRNFYDGLVDDYVDDNL